MPSPVKTRSRTVLGVGDAILQARIAAAEQRSNDAISNLRQAAAAEDRLAYDEPKDWFFPARHLLGAQLLQAGKLSEAETVYREDLKQYPANGWSLYGLSAALKARGKKTEAAQVARQFQAAWRYADVTPAGTGAVRPSEYSAHERRPHTSGCSVRSGRANLLEDVLADLSNDMNVRIAGLGDVVAHGVREDGCNFWRTQTVVHREPF
jgi:tetratricopeptide (TPR) repeat protein